MVRAAGGTNANPTERSAQLYLGACSAIALERPSEAVVPRLARPRTAELQHAGLPATPIAGQRRHLGNARRKCPRTPPHGQFPAPGTGKPPGRRSDRPTSGQAPRPIGGRLPELPADDCRIGESPVIEARDRRNARRATGALPAPGGTQQRLGKGFVATGSHESPPGPLPGPWLARGLLLLWYPPQPSPALRWLGLTRRPRTKGL